MPDIPDSTATTASVTFDDTFTGVFETVGDSDYIRIDVEGGQWVQLDLTSTGDVDMVLSLRSERGNVIVSDDNIFASNSQPPQVTFYAEEGVTYYAAVSGFINPVGADYTISASVGVSPVLSSLTWGTQWDDPTITVYFAETETFADSDGIDSDGWTEYERDQFRAAFRAIEAVANITFVEVGNAEDADLRLVLDDNQFIDFPNGQQLLGFFNTPDSNGQNSGVFNANGVGWDDTPGGGLEEGGYGYVTIMHELLHGLGLAHPHDTGGSSDVWLGVTAPFNDFGWFDLNQGIFTTMSYNSGYLTGDNSVPPPGEYSYGFEAGPMALDIAVLQALYGANMTTATGDDTYDLVSANASGTAWQTIWDAGGVDSIRHTGTASAIIDLRAATLQYQAGSGGYVSTVDGVQGGFTIANGVTIENASGGAGGDIIIGNATGNGLYGNGGDDLVFGGAGADTLDGGSDDDTIYGQFGDDFIVGGTGADVVFGGSDNDTIDGGADDDALFGNSGHDVISDGSGVNIVNGNSGNDTITAGGTLSGGTGADTLTGGSGSDTLLGGRGRDVLIGGDGADRLDGGMDADELTGGAGADEFMFSFVSDSYSGDGRRDIIVDFEIGADTINLGAIDADRILAGDQAFTFIGTDAFSGSEIVNGGAQVRIQTSDTDSIVQVDRNGDGVADMEIVVLGVMNLSEADFIL